MTEPAHGYAGDITPRQAWDLLRDHGARLVDVRTSAEWNFVGVPDLNDLEQVPITIEWVGFPDGRPNPDFAAQLRASLGENTESAVVFLCRSGVRSVGAARTATELGYLAFNIVDGFEGPVDESGHRGAVGWRAEGLPWRQG